MANINEKYSDFSFNYVYYSNINNLKDDYLRNKLFN